MPFILAIPLMAALIGLGYPFKDSASPKQICVLYSQERVCFTSKLPTSNGNYIPLQTCSNKCLEYTTDEQ
jgi:hypothetical protein